MKTPFPGMDPYLEHPSLWPDVHNRLIAAMADALSPMVAPKYYIGLERRAHLLTPDDIVFIGRPDLAVVREGGALAPTALTEENGVYNVEVPLTDEVEETFLEIHEVKSGKLITIIEVLSPANKLSVRGREQYERKRAQILRSRERRWWRSTCCATACPCRWCTNPRPAIIASSSAGAGSAHARNSTPSACAGPSHRSPCR
ncbi:MAG: DUF4058 family protein [Caldilineaceae bacterium]